MQSPGLRGVATILLVEDDVHVLDVVREMLEALGHRVLPASSGAGAMTLARCATPDIVVVDVVMPGLPSSDLVAALRDAFPHLRVVYISGYAAGDVRPRMFDAGDRYLQKPFSLAQLAQAVGR
jgi:two-component system, cell cycle sensor histidine kinase and response regulator CckA